jgi:hypothetical protein
LTHGSHAYPIRVRGIPWLKGLPYGSHGSYGSL